MEVYVLLKFYRGNQCGVSVDQFEVYTKEHRISSICDMIWENPPHVAQVQFGRNKQNNLKGGRMGRSDTVSLWYVSLLINTRFRFFTLE